ncbi:MAG TPA: hypothetical protein VEH29_10795 [Acidimicrobiales bacterium]|nr:hypothetical protein [Acidimicrobiales bacterium]
MLVCAAASCPADIQKECLRRVDEVNAQIPTVTFEAKDTAGRDLSAVKVAMDGQPLAERLEGMALSVDPGEHTFAFETPGQPLVTRRFIIQQGQKDRHETIVFGAPTAETPPVPQGVVPPAAQASSPPAALGPPSSGALGPPSSAAPGAPSVPPPPAQGASPGAAPAPLAPPSGSGGAPPSVAAPSGMLTASPSATPESPNPGMGTQKVAAVVVAGVGVAALAVGGAFGVMTISKKNDANNLCPASQCASQAEVNMWNDAKTTGNVSTALFIVGGVGVAAGAILWFTAKPAGTTVAQIGLLPGGIRLRGTW